MKKRKETDSLGAINVPGDKYWGASTERSKKYFDIGEVKVRPILIKSIAIIKKSAAIVHKKDKLLSAEIANDADSPGNADKPVVPLTTIFTSSTSSTMIVKRIECDTVGCV